MKNETILSCRVDGKPCAGGSDTCGYICAAHFPDRAKAVAGVSPLVRLTGDIMDARGQL